MKGTQLHQIASVKQPRQTTRICALKAINLLRRFVYENTFFEYEMREMQQTSEWT